MKKIFIILFLIIFNLCVTVPEEDLSPEEEEVIEDENSPSWINFNPFGSKNKP
jgi:hypothetical protein